MQTCARRGSLLRGKKNTLRPLRDEPSSLPAGASTTLPLLESSRAASSARIASRAQWSVVSLAESAPWSARCWRPG